MTDELDTTERDRLLDMVEHMAFFHGFTNYEKKRIASHHAHFQSFAKGDYIIREGTMDSAFFILVEGRVTVTKGDHLHLATLGRNDLFGELAFLTKITRSSNVIASTDGVLIRVDSPLLTQLSAEIREKIKDKLIEKMAQRLVNMTQRFLELSPESG